MPERDLNGSGSILDWNELDSMDILATRPDTRLTDGSSQGGLCVQRSKENTNQNNGISPQHDPG
jgi:hypothetical protein